MKGHRRSSGSSSRVRFSGAASGDAHGGWYRGIAEHYDAFANPLWTTRTVRSLDRLFRRQGVASVADLACGTFAIDLRLIELGYKVVGRDLSPDMVRVGRRALRKAGLRADLRVGDMRTVRPGRTFDAVLCLGTAFNYLSTSRDVRSAFRTFRHLLPPGGLLVLDTTNFDAWIDRPTNARLEVDHPAPDGTRVAVFGFNEQNAAKTLHVARFLTVVQRGRAIDIQFDEAPLKVWSKGSLAQALRSEGFRPKEWWGDFAPGAAYQRRASPRLVAVALRS